MTATTSAESTLPSNKESCAFPAVAADELGFALCVFMAAANRTLVPTQDADSLLVKDQASDCTRLFAGLVIHGTPADPGKLLPYQASLHSAFAALWREYIAHDMRDSICARVLCFYFLMERTSGKAIEKWLRASPDRPEEVLLCPAVVEGLASIPLDLDEGLSEAAFVAAIGSISKTRYSA